MIHVYPGMGATASMYDDRWKSAIVGQYHNWPAWNGEQSIREMAASIISKHGIQPGDTVIGSSLGGIMAAEISQLVELKKLILIGSAIHPDEIRTVLKVFHPLVDLAPMEFIRKCAGKVPAELSQMFSETDPEFIRAMSKAVFHWEGIEPSPKLLRIHGMNDQVIPPPMHAQLIEGGHLIAMTNAEDCIQAIGEL